MYENKLIVTFNPKECGLFGQLNTQVGDSIYFGKRILASSNFIVEQQTVSQLKADIFSKN